MQTYRIAVIPGDGIGQEVVPAAITALDAVAAALSGRHGTVRNVAGVLHWAGDWPVLEPWAIACDSVVSQYE